MYNGQLRSVPLGTHLEFIASPTPVLWIQTQPMAWNTVFPTGKTLKCAEEKGLLENMKYLL